MRELIRRPSRGAINSSYSPHIGLLLRLTGIAFTCKRNVKVMHSTQLFRDDQVVRHGVGAQSVVILVDLQRGRGLRQRRGKSNRGGRLIGAL